jgi:putative transposase
MARGKKYTEQEILKVLREIEGGATIASVARENGIPEQTIYRWRDQNGRRHTSDQEELRTLQAENQRLKRIVARQALEIDAYRELTDGTW